MKLKGKLKGNMGFKIGVIESIVNKSFEYLSIHYLHANLSGKDFPLKSVSPMQMSKEQMPGLKRTKKL